MDLTRQAYPVQDDEKLVGEYGVDILEYFAARAPHEPQAWFRPFMPDRPTRPDNRRPPCNNDGRPATADEKRVINGWILDPCFDLIDTLPDFSDYEKEEKTFWKSCDDWDKSQRIQTYAQWPWAWAKAVLEAKPENR